MSEVMTPVLGVLLFAALVFGAAATLLLRRRGKEIRQVTQAALAQRKLLEDSRGFEARAQVLEAITDRLDEGILALNRDLRIVFVNRRALEMFDVQEPVVGKPLLHVVRNSAAVQACERALIGIETSERISVRFGEFDSAIAFRVSPFASDEIAVVVVAVDVTQLERLETIRRNFISDFSHEVRTPLASVRSALESFDGPLSVQQEEQLRRIMARQVTRLERLVDDLSELSRIEAGDLTLHRQPVELRRLLLDLCEDFRDKAAARGMAFLVDGDDATATVDPLRAEQAFSNLIDNAIKYGAEGKEIHIEVRDRADHLAVRITDQGEGIQQEELERIFHRFYRVDKSRSQEVPGTGLGLAISKHLIRLHGGSIRVDSRPGKGSAFEVRLPKK